MLFKKSILLFSLLTFSNSSFARSAPSIDEIMNSLQEGVLEYIEKGKVRGYVSTESCLYRGADFVLIQNYCFPKRSYPAKSFTLISAKFGILEFYEEKFSDATQREVLLFAFPEDLKTYFKGDLKALSISSFNRILEKLDRDGHPSCWATNLSNSDDLPYASCYKIDPSLHQDWLKSALDLTQSPNHWASLFVNIPKSTETLP